MAGRSKTIVGELGVVVVLVVTIFFFLRYQIRKSFPQVSGELTVAGLHHRVQVHRDPLGMPVLRADPDMNEQPGFYPPLTADVRPGDPFTPIMRAYENDRVQMRVLVGAQEEGHNFLAQGLKWLLEPSWSNSGYRNFGMMGISGRRRAR